MVRLGAIAICVAAVLPLAAIAHGAVGWMLPGEHGTAASQSESQCAEIAASEVQILPHGFLIATGMSSCRRMRRCHPATADTGIALWGSWGHPLLVPPGAY